MGKTEILKIVEDDPWIMGVINKADSLNLSDWLIGAGFVRNKVWDYLHGYNKPNLDTADIDLVYYDPNGNNQEDDEKLSEELKKETRVEWEVVNQFYAHKWNGLPPYKSTEDAISQWPETVTAIGVKLEDGKLKLVAPYGIDDLVNMIIRPSPKFNDINRVKERVQEKGWLEKWPKLKLVVE
ncbi:MAG: nucleotidyltransferase family protein [bacterium]|nr:nucleotidyltransferase family protein [bacterium]